ERACAHAIHPALLDGCFQVLLLAAGADGKGVPLPVSVERFILWANLGAEVWCRARLTHQTRDDLTGDLWLYDLSGRRVAEMRGLRCRRVGGRGQTSDAETEHWLYRIAWRTGETEAAARPAVDWCPPPGELVRSVRQAPPGPVTARSPGPMWQHLHRLA